MRAASESSESHLSPIPPANEYQVREAIAKKEVRGSVEGRCPRMYSKGSQMRLMNKLAKLWTCSAKSPVVVSGFGVTGRTELF